LKDALTIFRTGAALHYLLHIPLIHVTALVVWYVFIPEPQQWSLALLYLVFAVDVALLYVACRWYAGPEGAPSAGVDAVHLRLVEACPLILSRT
jgi:hypothetical protein